VPRVGTWINFHGSASFCMRILYISVKKPMGLRQEVFMNWQGHLVFGDGVAQQVQNKLKGFVPHGALLAWHAPHEPKPCLKVDFYDSTAAAPHRGLRRDSRLSPLSGQTPSLACHALVGLLCDVVWLPQLECHCRMGAPLWHRYRPGAGLYPHHPVCGDAAHGLSACGPRHIGSDMGGLG